MSELWISVCPETEFELGKAKVAKGEESGKRYQIAVFKTEEGRYDAVDNLCPHEGYPLVQGYVKDCVLTCAWHNFKFRLDDGECIKGDEAVAVYPTRVRDGVVEVQLRSAVRTTDVSTTFASLREGLLRDQLGRVSRDTVRLIQAGVPAEVLLLAAARFDAERAEWGTTHALPVAADLLGELDRFPGVEATLPIMQAMELASEPNVRREVRALAEPIAMSGEPAERGAAIREAVEAEDAPLAEGLLLGALEAGLGRVEVEPWFFRLCCDHFLGFGHPLIYVTKAFDLLGRLGFDYAPALLPALLFRIANSTREDTLPPMEYLEAHLALHCDRLSAWSENSGALESQASLRSAVLDGNKHEACAALTQALESGAGLAPILDELARAASERMMRFDIELGRSNEVQEGWLDLTHGLTFVHAIRRTLDRYAEPERVRLLFQAAHFLQRTGPLDLAEVPEPPSMERASLEEIASAIVANDELRAVALVSAYLAGGGDRSQLRDAYMDYAMSDALTRPIVVAHGLKTCLAAFAECEALDGDPLPILAFTRFVASPIRERALARVVHEAIRFLVEGSPPKRLTS